MCNQWGLRSHPAMMLVRTEKANATLTKRDTPASQTGALDAIVRSAYLLHAVSFLLFVVGYSTAVWWVFGVAAALELLALIAILTNRPERK